jgi:hypothetical protein
LIVGFVHIVIDVVVVVIVVLIEGQTLLCQMRVMMQVQIEITLRIVIRMIVFQDGRGRGGRRRRDDRRAGIRMKCRRREDTGWDMVVAIVTIG